MFSGITRFHHFLFENGTIKCREFVDSVEEVFDDIQIRDPPITSPEVIEPDGLSIERQWYLFKNVRSLCRNEMRKDNVAPKPTTNLPSKRKRSNEENTQSEEEDEPQSLDEKKNKYQRGSKKSKKIKIN